MPRIRRFLKENRVQHIISTLYHPLSNRLAERVIQIIKRGLKRVTTRGMSALFAEVLFTNSVLPYSTTGNSPVKLMLGCQICTKLNLVCPNTAGRVGEWQEAQKAVHNSRARSRAFKPGDKVYIKNYWSAMATRRGCEDYRTSVIDRLVEGWGVVTRTNCVLEKEMGKQQSMRHTTHRMMMLSYKLVQRQRIVHWQHLMSVSLLFL